MVKKCTKCGLEFPATKEYFRVAKNNKDGLKCECKICQKEKDKKYRENNREKILKNMGNYKSKNNTKIKQYHKDYYSKNEEKIKKYRNEYSIKNYNKIKQQQKEYYYNHKDIIDTYQQEYTEKNRERKKIHLKKYSKTEHGKLLKKIREQKRRSIEKDLDSSFSIQQWNICKDYFNNSCCYCGKDKLLTQDHFIPLSNGGEYTNNNILPACKSCNSSKINKDFFKWYPKQEFYNKNREQKILKYLNYDTKTKVQQLALI